ncbi:hypothetical protein LG651_08690 [Tamlana sp. 62-3]|uniref:Import component protein n=1 Tax=Neotamlana sargassicola TaxID=2883125 RepID=A0A9X1L4M1_9FLAO|nr:hypothetical protein [Tamlana sargassicola]MCB4808327.1 hypothetical protein [Tamlana sargassicola]
MTTPDIEAGHKKAIISYITIFGTIYSYYMNSEKPSNFASFHIRQALGLWLTFFVLGYVIGNFDSWYATLGFYLFFCVLFIFGFANAVGKKAVAVPLIGNLYQKLFANLGS